MQSTSYSPCAHMPLLYLNWRGLYLKILSSSLTFNILHAKHVSNTVFTDLKYKDTELIVFSVVFEFLLAP